MDIRQLELFIAAAEEQHFTRAARRANIVQSGLSVAIRGLEAELGTRLFVRNTRRVQLSEAGRIFLPEARRVLGAAKRARDAVAAIKGGLIGRLSVGTVQSLHPFLDLPALLQAFHERYPKVEIAVREINFEALRQALREGHLDLAFMPTSDVSRIGLAAEVLFSSPMVVAVSPDHPIADRAAITLSELEQETFVDFSPRWGTRHLVDQIFHIEGAARRTGFEVENFELLLQFVSRGFGLAVVPQAMVERRQLRSLKIVSARAGRSFPKWELGLFRAETDGQLSPNPPADVFRAMVKEAARTSTSETTLASAGERQIRSPPIDHKKKRSDASPLPKHGRRVPRSRANSE
jgi:DNA-binding transcriptional LysR family regulator